MMRAVIHVLLFCAASAFVPRRSVLQTRRHALSVVPISVEKLDDALTAKLIEVELVEMLDREWIEQDCHGVLGRRAGAAFLEARRLGLDDVGDRKSVV